MDLTRYVPDIDAYIGYWLELAEVSKRKVMVEADLDQLKNEIIITATTNPLYFKGDKPLAMNMLEKTYLVAGYDPITKQQLTNLFQAALELETRIMELKGKIKAEEMRLSVFQTLSANSRNVVSLGD